MARPDRATAAGIGERRQANRHLREKNAAQADEIRVRVQALADGALVSRVWADRPRPRKSAHC
jgi:hypothetical protein